MQTNWRPVTNDDAGKELVIYHEDLIDLDFNPQGTGIGVVYEDINGGKPYAVIARWVDMQDCYSFDTVSGPFMVHDKPTGPMTTQLAETSNQVYDMGVGKTLTSSGMTDGTLFIAVCDVPEHMKGQGSIGDPAPELEEHLKQTGTFIKFHNGESMLHFLGVIQKLVQDVHDRIYGKEGAET